MRRGGLLSKLRLVGLLVGLLDVLRLVGLGLVKLGLPIGLSVGLLG